MTPSFKDNSIACTGSCGLLDPLATDMGSFFFVALVILSSKIPLVGVLGLFGALRARSTK
jgi:hypothetical protein